MTANQLREARLKLGLTQVQLAAKLEIPANTLARWERGEFAIAHSAVLALAIQHLSCKPRKRK